MKNLITELMEKARQIEDIKGIILSNVIVRIMDNKTGQVLWECKNGESHGRLKKLKIDVEQDLDLAKILEQVLKLFNYS